MTLAMVDDHISVFVHVLGAALWVATLLLALLAFAESRRGGSPRFGFLTLLRASIPAYIVMRVGAQWAASHEGIENAKLTWLDIGFIVSDLGALLLIIATVVAGIAARRERRGDGGRTSGLANAAFALTSVLLVASLVAVWAMTTRPG